MPNRVYIWVGLVGIIGLLAGFARSATNPYDDAYITYRYAANFAAGNGFVYNVGEWVLGTTAPLYGLVLGILGWFTDDFESLGHALGTVAWAITAGIVVLWFKREQMPLVGVVASLLILIHPALPNSIGMETPVVVALMVLSAWAWLGGRWLLACLLLAALILTRQDGALWALFVGLEVWRRTGRFPIREGVLTTLFTLPWFAYAFWRYGSILPNSAGAKIGQNDAMAVSGDLAQPFYQRFLQTASLGQNWLLIFILLLLVCSTILIIWRKREWVWLLAWLVAYLIVYTGLGVISFPWYFVPPLVVVWLLVALSAEIIPNQKFPVGNLVTGLFAVALFSVALPRLRAETAQYPPAYKPAGEWLAVNAPADATVAAVEIGAIGYFSQRPIIDTMGLVTPAMTERLNGWQETVVYATETLNPDYAIVPQATAFEWLTLNWWFADSYEQVAVFDNVSVYQKSAETTLHNLPVLADFDTGIQLTNVRAQRIDLGQERAALERIPAIPHLDLYLDFQITADQTEDYFFTVFLNDSQTFERVGPTAVLPFDGGYRSNLWREGDTVSVPARLELPADLRSGSYHVGVDLNGQTVLAGWLFAGAPATLDTSDLAVAATNVKWENGVALQAIGRNKEIVNNQLTIAMQWQASQPIDRDLKTFVHLLDSAGNIVAQRDQRPFAGRWAVPTWPLNEAINDQVLIDLPADLASGSYDLRIGWYDDVGRILLANSPGDFVVLPDIHIVER